MPDVDWTPFKTPTVRRVEEEVLGGHCFREYLLGLGTAFDIEVVAADTGMSVAQIESAMQQLRLGTRRCVVDLTEELQ